MGKAFTGFSHFNFLNNGVKMKRKLIISDFDEVIACICPKWVRNYIQEYHPEEMVNIQRHVDGVNERSGYYMNTYTGLDIDYQKLLPIYSNDATFYDDLPYEKIVDGFRTGLQNRHFDLAVVSMVVGKDDAVNRSKERMYNSLFKGLPNVSLHLVHDMSKREYVEKNGLDHYDVFIDDKFETIADLMAHHKNKEFKLPFMNYNSIKSEEEEEAVKQVLSLNNNQMYFYKS